MRSSKHMAGKRSKTLLRKGTWNPRGKYPRTKEIMMEHGVDSSDNVKKISDVAGASAALRKMAKEANVDERLDHERRAEALIEKNGEVGDALVMMMQFEDCMKITEESQQEYLKSVQMYRTSLERELSAIEHAIKKLESLKIHELAKSVEAIASAFENPVLRGLIERQSSGG